MLPQAWEWCPGPIISPPLKVLLDPLQVTVDSPLEGGILPEHCLNQKSSLREQAHREKRALGEGREIRKNQVEEQGPEKEQSGDEGREGSGE